MSPIAIGLAALVKSTAVVLGSSAPMGCLGVSPMKASSVLPFLQASKWFPYNSRVPVSKNKIFCEKMISCWNYFLLRLSVNLPREILVNFGGGGQWRW